jgi:hypothetical protein
VELLISKEGREFRLHSTLKMKCQTGLQMFALDPIGPSHKYLQVRVMETYGAE